MLVLQFNGISLLVSHLHHETFAPKKPKPLPLPPVAALLLPTPVPLIPLCAPFENSFSSASPRIEGAQTLGHEALCV